MTHVDYVPGDQWTGLAASRGPEEPRFPKCKHEMLAFACPRCTRSKRAYIDGKGRGQRECARTHQPMLTAAYRAGELAGLVKMGAGLCLLAGLAWVLGGRKS